MKFNFPINNFTAGEWSPKMQARTDTEQYPRSCSEVTNMFIQMHGGAQYRGNTNRQNIVTAGLQTDLDALLGTTDDVSDKFMMVPYTNHDTSKNTTLVIYQSALNGKFNTLNPGAGITYGANTNTANWTPKDTQFQQVGDLLFLVNTTGLFKPKVFYASSSLLGYTLSDIDRDYITASPWTTIPWSKAEALDSNVTFTHSGSNAVGGSCTVTASAAYFTSSCVGRYIRLCNAPNPDGVLRITGYTSTTVVTGTVLKAIPALAVFGSTANATSFWQISDWGNDVGWPKTITAFQGRVIFGGTATKTDTIWGSRISNVFDMQEIPSPDTTGIYGFASSAFASDNSRPFTLTPNSAQSSNITALGSAKTLAIYTDALEIVAYGSNGALGPNNVVFDSSTSFGSSAVQPVRINSYATSVQGNGYKLRDLVFNFTEDQYKATDLSFVAEHLFLRKNLAGIPTGAVSKAATIFPVDDIIQMVKYERRSSMLLCLTRSGKLYYVTLDRDYQVNAWGRFVVGTSGDQVYPYASQPRVLTMSNLAGVVTLLVERTFNGTKKCTVEYLSDAWEIYNTHATNTNPYIPDPLYLDYAWYAYGSNPDGSGKSTVWWASSDDSSFYANTTVSLLIDGAYGGEVTIGSDTKGAFTIPYRASSVVIGFKYPGVLITSPLEVGGQVGVAIGRIKRIDEMVVRFVNSANAQFGKEISNMETIPFRQDGELESDAPTYYSGDKVVGFPTGYDRQAQVIIKQDKPYPLYVVSITPRGVTYD